MGSTKNMFGEVTSSVDELMKKAKESSKHAFKVGDYRATTTLSENIQRMKQLKKNMAEIHKEFNNIEHSVTSIQIIEKPRTRGSNLRGKVTTGKDFITPILKSINELGGSVKTSDVLKKVKQKMSFKLNEFDKQPLPSNPSMPRWKQTAQSIRVQMVNDGLLKKDSPRGVWEISAQGRKAIESDQKKSVKPKSKSQLKGNTKANSK